MKRFLNKKIRLVRLAALVFLIIGALILNISWAEIESFKVESGYYGVDNDNMVISGVLSGVSASDFLSRCYSSAALAVSDGIVKTGSVVSNGFYSYAVAVTGDVDCDSAVSDGDIAVLSDYISGGVELSDAQLTAADVNGDGTIDQNDVTLLESCVIGSVQLEAHKSQSAETPSNFRLLELGTQASWTRDDGKKVKYKSSDEEIVTVDESGNITPVAAGTAVITAKTGRRVDTMLVTVLTDTVQISLEDAVTVMTGSTKKLTPSFNHPYTQDITWTSSDEAVATVSQDGEITPVSGGSAVITATISNGQSASVDVSVINTAQELGFSKEKFNFKLGETAKLGLTLSPADSNDPITWTSSDESIATVDENGNITGHAYGVATVTATAKYSGLTASCEIEIRQTKQVALTFDDGPGMYTAKFLDFLREKDIKVTFFMIGNLISRYPETVKQMAADGHELGYHSYDHSFQTTIEISKVKSDFSKTQDILYELTGRKATVWRSPGGFYNDATLSAVALPHIYWSVDTRDWEPKNQNADFVKNSILSQAKDGAIILCHDIYESTVDGAIEAIKVMLDEGYEFLTVTELLSRHGETPQASVTYKAG